MIEYPENWGNIGRKVSCIEISHAIEICLRSINVRNLSLSGGIDSSLLLFFMKKVLGDPIYCYTVAVSKDHPDYLYAKKITDFFDVNFDYNILPSNISGDSIVRNFYTWIASKGVVDIIAGDGIDEFTCGYYSHQNDCSEYNYISWLRRLQTEQLVPLNINSGNIFVYLPYLSSSVTGLLSLIPTFDKVDSLCRKKIMVEMAEGNIPVEIINRRKYGFCDAAHIKTNKLRATT